MRSFTDIAVFGAYLAAKGASIAEAEAAGLAKAGEIIKKDAQDRLGKYQAAAGPFPDWDELAERTKQDRSSRGFTPNDPLLVTGELRATLAFVVEGRTVTIGSPDPIAAYQEMGTPGARFPIPPRPFLGPAAFVKGEAAANAIAKLVAAAVGK